MSKKVLVATDSKFERESSTQRYAPPDVLLPRNFHFVWLTNETMTGAHVHRMREWSILHPGWAIEVWTLQRLPPMSSALRTLVDSALAAPNGAGIALASNIVRYVIIYSLGGVFMDVQVEPLRSLEPILRGLELFVVYNGSRRLCNTVFGAVAGHAFIRSLIDEIQLDVPPFGGWDAASWRTGERLVTSMGTSIGIATRPRTRAFATHIWFSTAPANGTEGNRNSFALHHLNDASS